MLSTKVQYIVNTNSRAIPLDQQIFMVDGTVPGWLQKNTDYLWDHHRQGGKPVQILEIPMPESKPLIQQLADPQHLSKPQVIATTRVDADACVAAAFIQLPLEVLKQQQTLERLEAIAWDCDHLVVPKKLKKYTDFAFKVVAGLKMDADQKALEQAYPKDRANWSQETQFKFDTFCFEYQTQWLIQASKNQKPWPGQNGEADFYQQQIKQQAQKLLDLDLIKIIENIAVFDIRTLEAKGMVDPRSCLMALEEIVQKNHLNLSPATLTQKNHPLKGQKYTLGCNPLHPKALELDYTQKVFTELSKLENQIDNTDLKTKIWGGRKTVGGSGWNHPSNLSPHEIIKVVNRSGFIKAS